MTGSLETQSCFEKNIAMAVRALRGNDYSVAKEYIKCAMNEDPSASMVHNLFGVLSELTGDLSLAGKHYRAAYALDPSYKPARRNLERITSINFRKETACPDYGDQPEDEEHSLYIVEYDDRNIGRLKKRSKKNEKE